ncbi:MAG: hypothetical protein EOP46_10035 [Sphingobacteriaceae bacterium]|nr:MAG: hypothetical protein EOP46_10035 [Sphingobacteriaceae bacterium]
MKVDNPAAFRFIFQEDVFLLNADKPFFENDAQTPLAEAAKSDAIKHEPAIKTEVISFKYLGKNNKRFLVLTAYTDAEFMTEQHLTALTSTLARKELSIEDVAIVNVANHQRAEISNLAGFFTPSKILVLGKDALPSDLSVPFNQATKYNDAAVLFTFGFAEMMSSNDNKKAFWEQVKIF